MPSATFPIISAAAERPLARSSTTMHHHANLLAVPYTIELQAVIDGNHWISIIDERTGKRHGPLLGPFQKEQVFNYLLRAGVHDDGKPDQLIREAELNSKAKISGIEQSRHLTKPHPVNRQ